MPSQRSSQRDKDTDPDSLYYVRRKARGGAHIPDPPRARPFVVPPHIAALSKRPKKKAT
jgi:hypothetical protein